MKIQKFTTKYAHLTKDFTCGNFIIDKFLKDGNALDENQGITYILLSDEADYIIGYYNIEVGRIDQVETINDVTIYKPMGGTVHINYLAIHSDYQRTKIAEYNGQNIYLGDYLLRDCEKRILNIRSKVGIAFVTLYSTEQGYYLYHERNSYDDFDDDMSAFIEERDLKCHKLYKWIDDIVGVEDGK